APAAERLFRMLCALMGQAWNASDVGRSFGVTHTTVNTYVDVFEGAFLVRRLRPYLPNLSKRLTKRPRLFIRDTGLLHATQLVNDLDDLVGRPWVGASWEGFVIEQVIGCLQQQGRPFEPWFFRTSDGYELDLLVDFGSEKLAIEVKLTTAPRLQAVRQLKRAAELVGATQSFLISRTAEPVTDGELWSCRLEHLIDYLTR
ncbi:MAG: putative AAA+ superfamily ATPase, partial [Myxococcota bacterium]